MKLGLNCQLLVVVAVGRNEICLFRIATGGLLAISLELDTKWSCASGWGIFKDRTLAAALQLARPL